MVKKELSKETSYAKFETWIADTAEELDEEINKECRRYHPMGYGTSLTGVTFDIASNTFKGDFYRRTSCD
jgi:hypothetical protein